MRQKYARLADLVAEVERKKTENVERATRNLDPVTREEIMTAARSDAAYVESSTRRSAAGMLTSAVERVGREPRECPRLTCSLLRREDHLSPGRPLRDVFLDAAREQFCELLKEIDYLVAWHRKRSTGEGN